MRTITLYGRPGCHLCDEARETIERMLAEGLRMRLVEVDIEADERLHKSMLERIPVIEVEGRPVAELLIDADALRARLDTLSA